MRAILLGYYGADNHGDDMMLLYLLRWMKMQDIEVTVISENITETKTRFNINVVSNTPLLCEWSWFNSYFRGYAYRLIQSIKGHDMLVVGGGDLIRDDKGWRIFWYTMEKIVLALFLKKQVMLVNVGIGRPVTMTGRIVLKWALKKCKKIIVRDQRSLKICQELKSGDSAILIDDIVFNLPDILKVKQIEIDEPLKRKDSYVLVSMRGNPNVYSQYSLGTPEIKNIAKGLDYLVEKHGLNIVFIPFEKKVDDGEGSVVNSIFKLMKCRENVTICSWTSDLEKVLRLFRDASFIVAMRLHAAVLAVAYDKRCIVMPYDIKLNELAQQVGLTNIIHSSDLSSYDKVRVSMERAINEVPKYHLRPDILKDIKLSSIAKENKALFN